MTAASSRTPRTPTYRDRDIIQSVAYPARDSWQCAWSDPTYVGRHRAGPLTPAEHTVAAIVERVR